MTLGKKLSLGALIILVVLMACLSWVLATESGARFLLARAQPYLPAELELGELHGSFIGGLGFVSVNWNSETLDVAIRDLSVEVEWARLLSRHLAVRSLDVAEIDIATRPASDTDSAGGLPSVDLPLDISVDSSSLRKLSLTQDGVSHEIDEVRLNGSIQGSRLDVTEFIVRSSWLNASLDGRITVRGDYPGRIRLDWRWIASPSQTFAGQLRARGDLRRYDVEHTLQLPQGLSTKGHFSFVESMLVFDLTNTWAALEWPVDGSVLTSTGGTLRLAGNPSNVDVSLEANASFADIPPAQIDLQGMLDPNKIRMTRLHAESDLGRLVASGDIGWQPALMFDVAYSLEELDPSLASGLLTGQVNASGTAAGEWANSDPAVSVVVSALSGRVNNQPLRGDVAFDYSKQQFTVSNSHVQLGSNRLDFSGAVGDRFSLDARAEFSSIQELLPDASGSLSASIELRGSRERPDVRIEASGIDLSWSDYGIGNFAVDAAVSPSKDVAMTVNLEKVLVGDSEIDSASLAASGKLDQHTLQTEVRRNGSSIVAESAGAYVDGRWTGVTNSLVIDDPKAGTWSLSEPTEFTVSRDIVLISRACLERATGTGRACIEAAVAPDRPTTFDVAINDLPLSALPAPLPAEVTTSGFVDVRAGGAVTGNRLTGEGSLSLRDARIDAVVDDETISVAFARANADISVVDNRAVTTIQLELADDVGSTTFDLTIDDIVDTGSAVAGRGKVEINDLSLFAVLLPDVARPHGAISGNLDISGSLGEPEFLGELALSDGGFGLRRTGIEISDINARVAQLSSGRLQLEGQARSGDGEITIRGDTWASADAGIRSEFLITGEDFELSRLPDWQVAASPSIAVVFDDHITTVTGNLYIPITNVRVKDIPDSAAAASPDTVVHRGEGVTPVARRRIDVDIAVGLGEDVRFAGFGLSTGIEGAVRVRGGTHVPYTGSGRLSLRDGRYKAYGQELDIERGQLIFNGPLDNPQLDIRAVRRMTDVTAGIALSGTPSQLRSSLFSEPPLGDAETLSYLLTGRPLSGATSQGDGDMLNAAAFALGVSGAGNIVTQVRSGLGLDTLAVEGGADDGRLIAGKRFGNRLLVEYGYGLIDKLGTLLLRYQLSDRIILESRTGTISNFDVLYSVKKK